MHVWFRLLQANVKECLSSTQIIFMQKLQMFRLQCLLQCFSLVNITLAFSLFLSALYGKLSEVFDTGILDFHYRGW